MSNGKRKGKKQRAQQRAQQRVEQAMLLENGKIEDKSEAESTAERTNGGSDNKNPRRKDFMRWIKEKSSFTDWCLVFFTGVLAVAAIYQFWILNGQLDAMRKDQRPWIKMTFGINELRIQSPISGTAHIVNEGKTPAREIYARVVIEEVQNGKEPKLDYNAPHGGATTGTLFPNEPPEPFTVMKRRISSNGTPEDDIFTQTKSDDFVNGRIFYVMYGTIFYTDFFGTKHWTKQCSFHVVPGFVGTFTAQKCTNYGDIDNN